MGPPALVKRRIINFTNLTETFPTQIYPKAPVYLFGIYSISIACVVGCQGLITVSLIASQAVLYVGCLIHRLTEAGALLFMRLAQSSTTNQTKTILMVHLVFRILALLVVAIALPLLMKAISMPFWLYFVSFGALPRRAAPR